MRLVMLGTGGYHPNSRRHTAGLLLPELGLAFDAGTSAFRLQQLLLTAELDIFLTHAHLDHICGLTYLLVPLLQQQLRIRIHGREQDLAAVRELLFSQPLFPVRPEFDWRPWSGPVELSGYQVSATPVQHPGGALAYRLNGPDCSMAYVTDTTVDGTYTEFIRGVDLLVHECYFPDEFAEWAVTTGHSHLTPVLELARDAGVKRLLLTHIDPQRADPDPVGLSHPQTIFANVEIAEDGGEYEV